ncbi:hypothetical protein Pmar_PMAR007358 [Perkinsus marinus ATCC 50983]|uniref:Uncharacterized protein n=1 Tax=Perkinsus marinus (strain ATCC 50983 / TXsc) TaxID=423536 RepID=C5K643_PERM5|nr:hypothetical protein Pmar_PMAR007358 [Perkinsus marinus ATCC 50983]EER20073.1 hypothetical protein Pmar_PMAR007358 [Perkinsus marinus ATCC 50983]|eukprot:XP_002788277.1 hypothetical protein Pmar_PMAR007358 [Perkinsus marinus ATCC 50983]
MPAATTTSSKRKVVESTPISIHDIPDRPTRPLTLTPRYDFYEAKRKDLLNAVKLARDKIMLVAAAE